MLNMDEKFTERRKNFSFIQSEAKNGFKCHALHASLLTSQQNASTFNAIATAFCAIHNQSMLMTLSLPKIQAVTKVVLAYDDHEEIMEIME